MKNKIEYIVFLTFSIFFRILGLKISRKFSVIIALFFYYLIPIRKETVIENLKNAYPDYSEKKIKEISFQCYRSFAVTLVEILYMPYMSSEMMKNSTLIKNQNLVKEKYNLGKGVVLLSAHFGNWEYIAAAFAIKLNIPFSVVVKSQRNPYVTEWLNNSRIMWGNKIVPLGVSIRQIYKELKNKNIVAMIADQRGPAEGVRVHFFGRPASIYTGPAALALKTGAPILMGIAVRQPDFSYITEMVEISTENLPEDEDEKIKEISQRHTNYLEEMIRKHPEQWFWMHKRWKY